MGSPAKNDVQLLKPLTIITCLFLLSFIFLWSSHFACRKQKLSTNKTADKRYWQHPTQKSTTYAKRNHSCSSSSFWINQKYLASVFRTTQFYTHISYWYWLFDMLNIFRNCVTLHSVCRQTVLCHVTQCLQADCTMPCYTVSAGRLYYAMLHSVCRQTILCHVNCVFPC
jgi:hypothetical protein